MNLPFEYQTKVNRRLKRARLSIREGGVLVEVPGKVSQSQLTDWLHQCAPRVQQALKQQQSRLNDHPLPIPSSIATGEAIPYLGEAMIIRCLPGTTKSVKIVLENDTIFLKSSACLTNNQKILGSALKKWYKDQLLDEIDPFLMDFYRKTGLGPEQVRFKDNITNWGSCSSLNNINLNWRLVFAPRMVLANVVYHELCHLIHRDHSRNFYSELAKYHPEYEHSEAWLNQYGFALKMILP